MYKHLYLYKGIDLSIRIVPAAPSARGLQIQDATSLLCNSVANRIGEPHRLTINSDFSENCRRAVRMHHLGKVWWKQNLSASL